jgi:hypothetical protein
MSEPQQATETPEVLRSLGGACLGVYLATPPGNALYARAVVAEMWDNSDVLGLLQQLGAIPQMAQGGA